MTALKRDVYNQKTAKSIAESTEVAIMVERDVWKGLWVVMTV